MSKNKRTYSMSHGFTAEDGSETSCDIIYTVSGDPRDAVPQVEIVNIGFDDADLRRGIIVVDHIYDQAAEIDDAVFLAHANEFEREARIDNADARGHAHREKLAEAKLERAK